MCAIATEESVIEVRLLLRARPNGVQQRPPKERTKENDDESDADAHQDLPGSLRALWYPDVIIEGAFVRRQKARAFFVTIRSQTGALLQRTPGRGNLACAFAHVAA